VLSGEYNQSVKKKLTWKFSLPVKMARSVLNYIKN
jgi:hypothetical protein